MDIIYKGPLTPLRTGALAATLDTPASATPLDVSLDSFVTLFLAYAVGTGGTGVVYVVEVSPVSSGDDWLPAEEALDGTAVAASGITTVPTSQARYSIDGSAGAGARVHTVRVFGAQRLRVRALETGPVAVAGAFVVRGTASRVGA